jgi:ATP-dependent DNA helicase RecG
MIVEIEKDNGKLPFDSLVILSRLREERRLTVADFAEAVQKPEASIRSSLEKLVEHGIIEPHGTGRGRAYTLSAAYYISVGKQAEYIRQAGFSSIQQEQMVLSFIQQNGSIKRSDVIELCHLNPGQATRLLKRIEQKGEIEPVGVGKNIHYVSL